MLSCALSTYPRAPLLCASVILARRYSPYLVSYLRLLLVLRQRRPVGRMVSDVALEVNNDREFY